MNSSDTLTWAKNSKTKGRDKKNHSLILPDYASSRNNGLWNEFGD